jgi:hypothetical protein
VQSTPQAAAAAGHAPGQQQQQESATPPEQQAAIIKHLRALADAEAAELDAAGAAGDGNAAMQQAVLNLDQADGSASVSNTDSSMDDAGTPIIFLNSDSAGTSAVDPTDSSSSSSGDNAASAPPVNAAFSSPVQRNLTFLQSSKLRLGLDVRRLGAVSWLSSSLIPEPWTHRNLINVYDQGR